MAEQLPLGVALGRVVGRLVGPSMPGHVGLPVAGARVVLEIDEARWLRAPYASPPVLILPDPVNCTTDSDGLLLDERGNPGVTLIATDAPEIELDDDGPWLWRATITAPIIGRPISWTFELPAGTTVNLSTGLLATSQHSDKPPREPRRAHHG